MELQSLPLSYTIHSFNRKLAESIKKYIKVLLLINRRAIKVPIIILSLRDYNIILSRKWAIYIDVLVNCRRYRLV